MHICRDQCTPAGTDAHLQGLMPVDPPAAEDQDPYDPFLTQTLCNTQRTYLELCKAHKPIQQLPQETGGQGRKHTFCINYPRNVIK